ncbi:MAG: hypothetical protein JXR97_12625 [Planctomycetes bacterium]|nr:hypothetical protein [Planctomycetota bacterium]
MKIRLIQLSLVLMAIPVFSGCWLLRVLGFPVGDEVPYNPKDTSGEVSVKEDIQFSDIPVPMGFVLRRNDSFSFQGTSFRFGNFVYEGVWGLQKTMAFYRRQMPLSGWELVEDVDESRDSQIYLYAKGRERCKIRVASTLEGIGVNVRLFNAAMDKNVKDSNLALK